MAKRPCAPTAVPLNGAGLVPCMAKPRKDLALRMEAMHARTAPQRARPEIKRWLQSFLHE